MLLASNLPPTGLPYSVATGIPSGGGPEEIAGYVASLRTQGFCVIEHVIPAEQVPAVLASVLAGRRALQAHRESQPPNPPQPAHGGSSRAPMDPTGLPAANATPRPPVATNDIAFNELFAEHVAEPRLTAVAAVMLDAHLRIAQTEVNKSRAAQGPGTEAYETAGGAAGLDRRMRQRGWHSDWPHDLTAYVPSSVEPWRHAGAVAQPFPDVCMALSTVWYLGPEDVTPLNGGTFVVPGSHRDPRNPRGPDDGIDQRAPIPGEFQVSAPAGSVFVQDTRLWHAGAANHSRHDRHAVVLRYAPWWLTVAEFGDAGRCRTIIPREVFARMKPEVQLLYRHAAEGGDDHLQPPKQIEAFRSLRARVNVPDELGDNSHVVVGSMTAEQWRVANAKL